MPQKGRRWESPEKDTWGHIWMLKRIPGAALSWRADLSLSLQHGPASSSADPSTASFPRKCWTRSLTVPLALKAAAAEMSVLMAYVRYWVCFLNLQLYKIVLLLIQEVRCSKPLWHLPMVWVLFSVCEARLLSVYQRHSLELNRFSPVVFLPFLISWWALGYYFRHGAGAPWRRAKLKEGLLEKGNRLLPWH